jgi:hypothetical protein
MMQCADPDGLHDVNEVFESGRMILREKMWVLISAVGALHVLLSLFFLEFHVNVHITNDTNLPKLMDCALNE